MKAKKAFALLLTMGISTTILPMTVSAEEIVPSEMTQQQQEEQQEQAEEQTGQSETEEDVTAEREQQDENAQQEQQTEQQEQQTEEEKEEEEKEQQQESKKPEKITITFDANGGQGEVPETIKLAGEEEAVLPEDVVITKENKLFVGWSTEKESTEVLFATEDKLTIEAFPEEITENVTLYAVWQDIRDYQILYDLGNNEIIRENTKTGQTAQNIPTQNKEGQEIVGWKNANDEVVEVAQIEKEVVTGNVAYRAVYDPSALEQTTQPEQPAQNENTNIALETEKHIKYMDGSDGNFYPEKALTRAEACQILYTLLKQKEMPTKTFEDVSSDSWYANAVTTLATMGIVEGYGQNFEPNREMTRAEFLTILGKIYPSDGTILTFSDVASDNWAIKPISNAAQRGWINPAEAVRPDESIKREEAAVILNRVLGRAGDKNSIDNTEGRIREFFDVAPTHYAYYDILEASVVHDYQKTEAGEVWTEFQKVPLNIAPGLYSKNGTLFYVEENGSLARNKTIGNFAFDENGLYTTNYQTLDRQLSEIVRTQTNEEMTQEQKLRALYNYVRDDYRYLKRPFVQKGQVGWEAEYAEPMIEMHKGNCYSFAALYYYLAKQVGYDAHAVIGTVGHNHAPHGWVEISMDGTTYLFDTEMDMAYRLRGTYYDLYKKTYSNAPFIYVKW